MDNISKEDICFRLNKIKSKANEINNLIEKNSKEFESRYSFAKKVGVKVENINETTDKVRDGINEYIDKVENVFNSIEDTEKTEDEYKLLNNILYLDDKKLKNINELINENKSIATREYINMFANKANDIIRQEEIKSLNANIAKYSKNSFIDKITGKAKIKKALLENYSLKKVQVVNKKFVPEGKSLYEIVSIVNNCGYNSETIRSFINNVVDEFNLESPENNALVSTQKEEKIPLFFNKEYLNKINTENSSMLDKINSKKKVKSTISEYKMYSEMLLNDVTTLELLNFSNKIEEVI